MKGFLTLLIFAVLGAGGYFSYEFYQKQQKVLQERVKEEQVFLARQRMINSFPELVKVFSAVLNEKSSPSLENVTKLSSLAAIFNPPEPIAAALIEIKTLASAVNDPRKAPNISDIPADAKKEFPCPKCNGRGQIRTSSSVLGSSMESRSAPCQKCKGKKTDGYKFDLFSAQVAIEARVALVNNWIKQLKRDFSSED